MTTDRKDKLGLVLIVSLFACLALGWGFADSQRRAQDALDPSALSPKGRTRTGVTEVLLDFTDPLSPEQAGALRARLCHLAQVELRKHELLSLWGIGDFEEGSLRRLFSRCNPGREGNWIYQDPARIAARFDTLFGDTLSRLASSLTLTGNAPTSPILESIQEVSELPEFARAAGPRRIIVVSDMLQNTGRFSNYRSGSDYEALRNSPAFEVLRADLSRASVEIVYLPRKRDASLQGPEHRDFWRQYLISCNAARVEFGRL